MLDKNFVLRKENLTKSLVSNLKSEKKSFFYVKVTKINKL